QHAPVDAVGAIALGGIFIADVGSAAEHALAARGLLAGRAVAGAVGEDDGADGAMRDLVGAHAAVEQGLHVGVVPGGAAGLSLAYLFGAADIGGLASGEGEGGELHGVGAVGAGLAGGDELV